MTGLPLGLADAPAPGAAGRRAPSLRGDISRHAATGPVGFVIRRAGAGRKRMQDP